MKKRIYMKVLHIFERSLKDAIDLYLSRPEGDDFQNISLEIVQLNFGMLLNYQADNGVIRIGNENWIEEVLLKEIEYKRNSHIEFEGSIKWKFKKKNLPAEFIQLVSVKFDLKNINKKRIPYKTEFKN